MRGNRNITLFFFYFQTFTKFNFLFLLELVLQFVPTTKKTKYEIIFFLPTTQIKYLFNITNQSKKKEKRKKRKLKRKKRKMDKKKKRKKKIEREEKKEKKRKKRGKWTKKEEREKKANLQLNDEINNFVVLCNIKDCLPILTKKKKEKEERRGKTKLRTPPHKQKYTNQNEEKMKKLCFED